MKSSAVVSADGVYRYRLGRSWNEKLPIAAFVMLNPSTADANVDDPTIRRCIRFAADWGNGGIVVVNLFALRATDPAALRKYPDPIGPRNDEELENIATAAVAGKFDKVIAAWGTKGTIRGRDLDVLRIFPALYALGETADGHPKHPLYVPAKTVPVLWKTSNGIQAG